MVVPVPSRIEPRPPDCTYGTGNKLLEWAYIQPIRLKNAAMAQKSKDKTTAAILKLYNEKCQAVDDTWEPVESITQVIDKVPGLGDDSLFNPWVAFAHANMSAKFEFPQKFLESVFNIMLTASNSKKALELKKVKCRNLYSTICFPTFLP